MGHQVLGRFVAAAIEGFSSNGRWPGLLEALKEIAPHRTDTTLYFAEMDEQVAGASTLASIDSDTDIGGVDQVYLKVNCQGIETKAYNER